MARCQGNVSIPVWSPDGQFVVFTADGVAKRDAAGQDDWPSGVPGPLVARRIDFRRDGRGWLGETRGQVFVADVERSAVRQLTDAPIEHVNPVWSSDSRYLAIGQESWADETSSLLLLNVQDGSRRSVAWDDGEVHAWAFNPGNDGVVIAGASPWSPQPEFWTYDRGTGTSRQITRGLACVPQRCGPLVWLDAQRVLFAGVERGLGGVFVLDTGSGKIETIALADARRTDFSVDELHRVAVEISDGPDHVGEICLTELESGADRL